MELKTKVEKASYKLTLSRDELRVLHTLLGNVSGEDPEHLDVDTYAMYSQLDDIVDELNVRKVKTTKKSKIVFKNRE